MFHIFPPKSHYLWIKDNPKFAGWAAHSLEEISDSVKEGAELVQHAIASKEEAIMKDIAELTGYDWWKRVIRVYPTFLGPSWSHPLSLKTARVVDGEPCPENVGKMVGVLIHELVHNSASPKLFPNRETSEQAMDLVALEVMRRNGFDTKSYLDFSERITAEQNRYVPESITTEELFNPTIKAYLANL